MAADSGDDLERVKPIRDDPDRVGDRVRAFYERLPFGYHGSVDDAVRSIRSNPVRATYPDLHALLAGGSVHGATEFGCGAGWLASSMAFHYGVPVVAVDFAAPALRRAREVARALGIEGRVRFVLSDLFDYRADRPTDLVISIGALHHTRDARRAFDHIRHAVSPGGHLYVGLYHEFGRRVFLELFRDLVEREGEHAALERYRAMDSARATDEIHLRSWFRDQVLHPHETRHTIEEVVRWLEGTDLRLASTSINRFEPIGSLEQLCALEREYEQRSRQANLVEGRFFPGFFTALATRCGSLPGPGAADGRCTPAG